MEPISRATFLTLLTPVVAASATSAGTLAQTSRTNVAAHVRSVIDRYIARSKQNGRPHVGCVVGIVTPQAPFASLLFGGNVISAADHNRTIPLNGDTPFEIGSITKTFASTTFFRTHGSYDGVLGDYIGRGLLPARIARVPIWDLATYSPGVPGDSLTPIWWEGLLNLTTLEGLVASLKANPWLPHCTPGQHYSYSNFAWGLLGLAGIELNNIHDRPLQKWYRAIRDWQAHLAFQTARHPSVLEAAKYCPPAIQ